MPLPAKKLKALLAESRRASAIKVAAAAPDHLDYLDEARTFPAPALSPEAFDRAITAYDRAPDTQLATLPPPAALDQVPSWAADHETWFTAVAALESTWGDYEKPMVAAAHVYKEIGGNFSNVSLDTGGSAGEPGSSN
jgi:hypothetical protein